MKPYLLFPLLLLLSVLTCPGEDVIAPGMDITFSAPGGNDWKMVRDGASGRALYTYKSEHETPYKTITVLVMYAPIPAMSVEGDEGVIESSFLRAMTNKKEKGIVQLGGQKAFRVLGDAKTPRHSGELLAYTVVYKDRIYVIETFSETPGVAKDPELKAFIDSVKFTP